MEDMVSTLSSDLSMMIAMAVTIVVMRAWISMGERVPVIIGPAVAITIAYIISNSPIMKQPSELQVKPQFSVKEAEGIANGRYGLSDIPYEDQIMYGRLLDEIITQAEKGVSHIVIKLDESNAWCWKDKESFRDLARYAQCAYFPGLCDLHNEDCRTSHGLCYFENSEGKYISYEVDDILLRAIDSKRLCENIAGQWAAGREPNMDTVLSLAEKEIRVASYNMLNKTAGAQGILLGDGAVCSGYAKAFKIILGELGIECYYVVGDTGEKAGSHQSSHAWNAFVLDGKTYWIDLTYADTGRYDLDQYISEDPNIDTVRTIDMII